MPETAEIPKNGTSKGGNENFRPLNSKVRSINEDSASDPSKKEKKTNFERYVDPQASDETPDFAFTEQRILEGYPFFGTLLKKKHSNFRIVEFVQQDSPITINEVEDEHGAGEYELRLESEDDEKRINFKVPEKEPETRNTQRQNQPGGIMDERLKRSYEDTISSLERTVSSLRKELDDKSREVRRLREGEFEKVQNVEREYKKEIRVLKKEKEDLKDDLRDIKFELREKEFELKTSDSKSSIETVIDKLVSDDGLLSQYIPAILQQMSPQQKQMALNGATQPQPGQPADQRMNPQGEQENTENEDMNSETQQTSKKQLLQKFANTIYNIAVHNLQQDEPNPDQVEQTVDASLQELQNGGVAKPPAQIWINIARKLIQYVDQNGISTGKLADVIQPLLMNLGKAKSTLKMVDAETAADMLQEMFGFTVSDNERKILIGVIENFKEKV